MTAATLPTDPGDSLALLLGRRQAEAMRFFWARGQATAQELRHWLARDSPLAYTTVATMCVRLAQKGLLDRQRTRQLDGHVHHGTRYLYTPRISEQQFIRTQIGERLAQFLAHEPALVCEHLARLWEARSRERGLGPWPVPFWRGGVPNRNAQCVP